MFRAVNFSMNLEFGVPVAQQKRRKCGGNAAEGVMLTDLRSAYGLLESPVAQQKRRKCIGNAAEGVMHSKSGGNASKMRRRA
jgi:hypothetical protein